ncbi:unnamed protein product [Phytophthora fragariaefolia]|uniref:Unnamed protein product n=1 Tax=Phytophthora fragariaefolia TaxID=1490495 RepID=A0A9W6Y572_9STRA|nr:unnamed protein product [Phytophthora fragariaefolia]
MGVGYDPRDGMARATASSQFPSWSFMEHELRSTFLLANVAYRHRSSLLRCKQGKRPLQDYIMALQNLEEAMASSPLSEDVKVTVFMDRVRPGPVRTELFRRQPKTFNEAVYIDMLEDHCVCSGLTLSSTLAHTCARRVLNSLYLDFTILAEPSIHALYSCRAIKDDDVTKEIEFDPATDQRHDKYIGLFQELQWYRNKKISRRSGVPEWQALCQSWSAFVEIFNSYPAGYRERVRLTRERYERFSKRPKIERLHWGAVEAGITCAVPMGILLYRYQF